MRTTTAKYELEFSCAATLAMRDHPDWAECLYQWTSNYSSFTDEEKDDLNYMNNSNKNFEMNAFIESSQTEAPLHPNGGSVGKKQSL